MTDELKKLMAEFEKELAILKGRVDGLEAKVGVLEAQQFSTTTKLKGYAAMTLGGVGYSSNNYPAAQAKLPNGGALPNALSFNYDVRLDFDTSFTGNDLLRTRLRAGNFGKSAFSGAVTGLTSLETAFQENNTNTVGGSPNVVEINRLFYQFPIGSGFTATFGGRVRQDDMLAMWPSVYPSDTVLDFFTYAGAPGAYSLTLGAGAGLWWEQDGFSISTNYVSANGGNGNPNQATTATTAGGGIGNTRSQSNFTTQVGYAGNNWGAAVVYNYSQNTFSPIVTTGLSTSIAGAALNSSNNLGLSAYWQPSESGWVPSISAGWGIGTVSLLGTNGAGTAAGNLTYASWSVGLQWDDVLMKGNDFGMGFGQPTMLTRQTGTATTQDGNWAWEWWYKFQVTDNISVTPALFYLSRPMGQSTPATASNSTAGGYFSAFGALLKTTFRF